MNHASRPPRDYEACGSSVRSDVPLPFIPRPPHRAGRDDPHRSDARGISLGLPTHHRADELDVLERPGVFLLAVDDAARYPVTNGRDVLVEPRGGSDHDLNAFLTGSVFAALLQQRGVVALHASAIETGAGAVLFPSRAGIGKMTKCASFTRRRGCARRPGDVPPGPLPGRGSLSFNTGTP